MPPKPKSARVNREQPQTVQIVRKQVVAEVELGLGSMHPLLGVMQAASETLHQSWGKNREMGPHDYDPADSTGMDSVEDTLEAEYGNTRLTIQFSPIQQ